MSEHTKEPLTYMELPAADGTFMVLGGEGQGYGLVASCTTLDDARRIVAAVNACARFPTGDLELCPHEGLFHLAAHANQLVEQRDELIAAIERLQRSFEFGEIAGIDPAGCSNALKFIRSIIAICKAQS